MPEKPRSKPKSVQLGAINPARLAVKAIILFLIANLACAAINPLPALGRLSAYNVLFPGRLRLPYGEDPSQSYNLSLFNLDAMFASHAVAAPKPPGEYRVILIGDSSTWGYLLKPDQTLCAALNSLNLAAPGGRQARFYNLGYPTLSLAKDLLILNYALRYQPDLIIWLFTLESFPKDNQLSSPLVEHNASEIQSLIHDYALNLDPQDPALLQPSLQHGLLQNTIVGRRRDLADLFRLQLYGVMWAATGIDQHYPASYDPPQVDLSGDETFHGLKPPTLNPDDLSMDVLQAGVQAAGKIPLLLVNEPVFRSNGLNSNIRYNFFYPRWAYDQYRNLLSAQSQAHGWHFLDLWDLLPAREYTNSAIHVTPLGEDKIAQAIAKVIILLIR